MRSLAIACLAVALGGCIPGEGPMMQPGNDCLECHQGGDAPAWSFAGTVFAAEDSPSGDGVQGVTVIVEDSQGRRIEVRSNEAGNFYSRESLQPPLRAWIRRGSTTIPMEDTFEYGGCNICHTFPRSPSFPEIGRLHLP